MADFSAVSVCPAKQLGVAFSSTSCAPSRPVFIDPHPQTFLLAPYPPPLHTITSLGLLLLTYALPPSLMQMVKPRERNTRYVDAVMTVPKGTLYPMCGMNLAFDR